MYLVLKGYEGVEIEIHGFVPDISKRQYRPCRFIPLYQLSRGYMGPASSYDTFGIVVMIV
jgi:hypothetical protein